MPKFTLPLFVSFVSSALSLTASTLAFQQGSEIFLNSSGTSVIYTSGEDVELREGDPGVNYNLGADSFTTPHVVLGTNYASFSIDGVDGGGEVQSLIKFGDIFGPAAHQIPAGSIIDSATLRLYEINSGNGLEIRGLLADWDQTTATWNNYGSGAGGASAPADVTGNSILLPDGTSAGDKPPTARQIDITQFMAAWSNGTLNNYGLVLRTDLNNIGGLPVSNGVDFLISEHPDGALRPMLEVTFTEVPEPAALGALVGLAALIVALRRNRG